MIAYRVRSYVRLTLAAVLLSLALSPVCAQEPDAPPNPRRWQWRFVAGGATVGHGAFSEDGRYYFAAEDRYLYAVDRNGVMIWRTDLGRLPAGSVVVGTDGTVFATLTNGELLALNRDGRLIWRAQISDERPLAPVVLRSGLVVTVSAPATLEARTHAGTLVWSFNVGSPVSCAPILSDDANLLVATADGDLVSVSIDGRLVRRRYVGEIGSVLAARSHGPLLGSTTGRVVALDSELEPLWRADLGSAVRDLRVSEGGDIYATGDDGSLGRITRDGTLAWRAEPGGAAIRSPVASDGVLVTVSDGLLTRLGMDGVAVWQMRLPDPPDALSLAPYGAVLVTTEAWVTYAYAVEFEPTGAWARDRGGSDRRGVARGADSGRVELEAFERSVDYLMLRELLLAGGRSEQVVAMSDLAARVEASENLAGEHQYILQLCEAVAGSPYFGPLDQFGPRSAPRRAREDAIRVLARIGDLRTASFLARLLGYEPDPAMQASILRSMGRLGAPVDAELADRLAAIVRADVARGPSDTLAVAVVGFVEAIDQYRGGYLSPEIANVLIEIAGSNYSRRVREYALDTVRSLARTRAP